MDLSIITDAQAEAGVIATLVYHPEFILHSDKLKPRYFYNIENSCIYWAIDELFKAGVTNIDAFNITSMLNSNNAVKKRMEQCGITDMQEFINMGQFVARHSLEEYKLLVNSVLTASFKRDLAKATAEIQSNCFKTDLSLSQLNEITNKRLDSLLDSYLVSKEIQMFGTKIPALFQSIRDRDTTTWIPSKFPSFEPYFKYKPGELVIIKARMKHGKSAFLMNEAIHKIKAGVPTLYIDTEMDDENMYIRMLANLSGIPYSTIDSNNLTNEEIEKLNKVNQWLADKPFAHEYLPAWDEDQIYAMCKSLKYRMGLRFLVFDYIKSNEAGAAENSNILGGRTDFLKNRIAGELGLAVLSGAQLSRTNDVADSDKIMRYCSTSIYWRYKTVEEIATDGPECGNIIAYVDINRNGRQMSEDQYICFNFDGDRMRIKEAEKQPDVKNATPFD